MNSRDQEQVRIYRDYLIEKARQSRSRLIRDQILRWLKRADAISNDNLNEDEGRDENRACLKKAA